MLTVMLCVMILNNILLQNINAISEALGKCQNRLPTVSSRPDNDDDKT